MDVRVVGGATGYKKHREAAQPSRQPGGRADRWSRGHAGGWPAGRPARQSTDHVAVGHGGSNVPNLPPHHHRAASCMVAAAITGARMPQRRRLGRRGAPSHGAPPLPRRRHRPRWCTAAARASKRTRGRARGWRGRVHLRPPAPSPPPPHPPHPPIPPFQRTPNSAVWSPHQPWPGGMRRTVAQEGRGSERSRGEGARASSHRACISTAREAGEGRKGRDHDWPGAPHVGAGAQTKHVTATAQGDLHHCSERRADSARFRVGPQCTNAVRLPDDSRQRQI